MIIDVFVEDPKGSTVRHVRDRATGTWTTYPFPQSSRPWPAHYGFIPGTLNPVDGDELDVLLLASGTAETGATIPARAVGILLRPDEDHKILAVAVANLELGQACRFGDISPGELRSIEIWFEEWSVLGEWADEHRAARETARSRNLAVRLQIDE